METAHIIAFWYATYHRLADKGSLSYPAYLYMIAEMDAAGIKKGDRFNIQVPPRRPRPRRPRRPRRRR